MFSSWPLEPLLSAGLDLLNGDIDFCVLSLVKPLNLYMGVCVFVCLCMWVCLFLLISKRKDSEPGTKCLLNNAEMMAHHPTDPVEMRRINFQTPGS